MKRVAISLLFLLGLLRPSEAQTITVTTSPGWSVFVNQNNSSASSHVTVTGAGTDQLDITAFSSTQLGSGNQTQATVVGVRTGSIPMSGATPQPWPASFGFMQFLWNGAQTRNVSASAFCDASGSLPKIPNADPSLPPMAPRINMGGSAQATITFGALGFPQTNMSATASAVVTRPAVYPGGLGAVNRLTITEDPPAVGIVPVPPGQVFFYSCLGTAGADATLKKGDTAFFSVNVLPSGNFTL